MGRRGREAGVDAVERGGALAGAEEDWRWSSCRRGRAVPVVEVHWTTAADGVADDHGGGDLQGRWRQRLVGERGERKKERKRGGEKEGGRRPGKTAVLLIGRRLAGGDGGREPQAVGDEGDWEAARASRGL